MNIIKTDIIPHKLWYYNIKKNQLLTEDYDYSKESLDLESIAFFAATGFFFNDSTYYKDIKVVPPASILEVDENNAILSHKSYWEWYYNPLIRDVEEATELFKMGFESNLFNAIDGKKVILPLSGGIDSRTIAAAFPDSMSGIHSYSYEFEGGVEENKYGREIARIKKYPFQEYMIPYGYLWDKIDELSEIVKHETEYVHSRQIAVLDQIEELGDIFVLGHGGEIFKAPQVPKSFTSENLAEYIFEEFIKEEGLTLGEKLWEIWGLKGDLKHYIKDNILDCLKKIKIKEANPKLRAFIYRFIAGRKNQVNVNIFARQKEIYLPFLNHDVLNGICNVHEDVLTGRKVQINYIKQKSPALAAVAWQNYDPLNLYNYDKFKKASHLPTRAAHYFKRIVNEKFQGKKLIIRNWENQLLGKSNDQNLREFLFNDGGDTGLIPENVVMDVYRKFKNQNPKAYVCPLSTLLTLRQFQKSHKKDAALKIQTPALI